MWTIDRPAVNPTPKQWVDAALAKGPWLHPDWFPRNIAETEHRTAQRIAHLDSFSPRSHWAWHEYLDFIWGGHMDVVYYDAADNLISSPQMPSYVWSDWATMRSCTFPI